MKIIAVLFLSSFFAGLCFGQQPDVPTATTITINPPAVAGRAPGQRLKIYANCILRYTTNTNCIDLKNTFFQQHSKVAMSVNDPKQSDLEFNLTDEVSDATHIGYTFKWVSHLPGTSSEPLILPLIIPTAFDPVSTLTQLVENAAKGLYFYFSVSSDSSTSSDSTVVVYKLPNGTGTGGSNWLERLSASPYYVNLSLGGSVFTQGSGNQATSQKGYPESLEFGYFKDKYKLDLTGSFARNSLSAPSGTGSTISATNTTQNYSGLEVYSFSKDWSVAVIQNISANPGANIQSLKTYQTGVEWSLVPFRTTENHELAFRIGPGYTTLNLNTPNVLNHLDENYLGAFAQIYFYWVTFGDKLILSGNATYNDIPEYQGYNNVNFTGSVTYQFNSVLSFTASSTYSDQARSLTFPGNPNYSNPLQSLFLSGQPGPSLTYTLGFNVKLGNSLKKIRDRRWATTSN